MRHITIFRWQSWLSVISHLNSVPKGLEDVSKFPDLIATLARRGLSESELRKVVGDNLLRVLKETERVSWIYFYTGNSLFK